jgi:hypothetical protein
MRLMKSLKWIALIVGLVVLVFVLIGWGLPARYHVERSVVIEAPLDAVYPVISRLKDWPTWTAWTTERYPDMKINFVGPESGVGAKYSWQGEHVGTGQLVLTDSDPARGIKFDLDFENGTFVSTGGIQLENVAEGTKATWWNEGALGVNPINRYCGLMMDSMMGPDFQTGLDNLKKKVEGSGDASRPQLKPDDAPTR